MRQDQTDRTKLLLRAVSDSIRRLDSVYASGKAIKTVFSYEAYGYRLRLKETLQKLMFIDSGFHTRKAEELIWRKVFYEPLYLYKLYVKNNDTVDHINEFESALKMHLISGVGYYQSLVLYSQPESFKDQNALGAWLPVPFHIPVYAAGGAYEPELQPQSSSHSALSDGKLIQKYLMYIGDLFRYLLELGEPIGKPLAYSYYNAALNFDPNTGLLHNQLGILDVGRCYGLNAIFHYLRCLCSATPFEDARRNLLTVLAKNQIRYQKLFGEKPVFGLYIRKPSRYRPKDFRKTITKFIYLVQHFIRPRSSDTNGCDPALSHVFHDTLFELHLMLSISAELTLEPEVAPFEDGGCLSEGAFQTEADEVTMRRHSSLFCERLTGPIFVRIAMITLLTANMRIHECVLRNENSEEGSHSKQEPSADKSVDNATESDSENLEASTGSASLSGTSSSCGHVLEPFGPLSFLLQLNELFMAHVSRQLDEHTPRSMNQYTFDSGIKSAQMSTIPEARDSSISRNRCDGDTSHEHKSNAVEPVEITSRYNRCPSRGSLPDDPREGTTPASKRPSQSTQDESEDENDVLDEDTLHRFVRHHSDDESDPVEEDEDEELADSDDADSSGDLWSPDDSSLLHSQDEMHTSDSSSADELRSYVNQRLRRAHLVNPDVKRFSKTVGLPGDGDGSVSVSEENASRKTGDRRPLDTIREEHSSCELKEHRHKRSSKNCRSPRYSSPKASRSGVQRKSIRESEVRYSKRIPHRDLSEPYTDAGLREEVESLPAYQHSVYSDITSQASIISRLYLLASIKLMLDWLCVDDCRFVRLLASSAAAGTDTRHIAVRYILQRWCTQLARFLNQLYPTFGHLSNELLNISADGPSTAIPDASGASRDSSKLPLLTDVLSAFGAYAIKHDLLPANGQTGIDNETAASSNSPLVRQTFPLPEDWLLRGLPSLKPFHKHVDFNRAVIMVPFTRLDEAMLRISCLISAGRTIASQATELDLRFSFTESATRPFHAGSARSGSASAFSHAGDSHDYWHGAPSRHHPFRSHRGRFISRGRAYNPDRSDLPGSGARRWRGCSKSAPKSSYRPEPYVSRSVKQEPKPYGAPNERHIKGGRQFKRKQFNDEKLEGSDSKTESEERENDTTVAKQSSNSSVPLDAAPGDVIISQNGTTVDSQRTAVDSESRKTQLMHDMARLRLITEVDHLARQCRSPLDTINNPPSTSGGDAASGSTQTGAISTSHSARYFVSPYIVLDAYCLCGHLSAVKELVNSGAFVLIIPVAVISHLDYLKKTTATARVAIRFLEHETHSGNRFLRLQRPEEQPEKLAQLSRWASGRKVAKSESPDGAPPATGPPDDGDPVANPRVVKRWLSILDCAVYFSQTKISMLLTEDAKRPETDSTDHSVVSQAPSRDCSPAALPLNIQSSLCCDLLHLNRISSDTNVPCADKTSLVSILVGSREAAPSDTIVPQEFVGLVNKYDIHLELLRDFMSRWRRSRQSHTKAKSKERNVT